MFCKHCGANVDDDSAFCSKCGGKLLKENKAAVQEERGMQSNNCLLCGLPLYENQKENGLCSKCNAISTSQPNKIVNDTSLENNHILDKACMYCYCKLTSKEEIENGVCDKCFIKKNSQADKIPVEQAKHNDSKALAFFLIAIVVVIGLIIWFNATDTSQNVAVGASSEFENSIITSDSEPETIKNSPLISYDEYSSINTGMTYEETWKIIGSYGTEISRASVGDTETVMIGWDGSGTLGANANFTFQNGKLIAKAQFGLK